MGLHQDEIIRSFPDIGHILPDGSIYAGFSPDMHDHLIVAAHDGPQPMAWPEGMVYAAALDVHHHRDWRLPTPNELDALYRNRVRIGNFSTSNPSLTDEFHSRAHYWAFPKPELIASWKKEFNTLSSSQKVKPLVEEWLKANGCAWGKIYGIPSQRFDNGEQDPNYCMVNRFSIRCVRTEKHLSLIF